jgi:peptidoglycan/xylan/chitin deacetylase (PgdA/CDA1 family)
MKVLFTVDTEVWTGDWQAIDVRFPEAFRRYVYGDTPQGQYALPMTLKILNDHGLKGVFFVEPIFSARFGLVALQEIVGLVRSAGHEVQLHVHPEWADEAREPILPQQPNAKRQHLYQYSLEEQTALIQWGKRRLELAGADTITAFRAGSFAFNLDTLDALAASSIKIDTSYNHCCLGPQSGLLDRLPSGSVPDRPVRVGPIIEYPVTVFRDYPGHLRPLQLTACSLAEFRTALYAAAEASYSHVVIVSHNFELLDRRDFSRDSVVTRRFIDLCRFLERNSDIFQTVGFDEAHQPSQHESGGPLLPGSWTGLAVRIAEQAVRRI